MIWEFIIEDRNGVQHIIDEPTGWVDMTTEIKRDLDTHGIFFDYQGNDFQFDGLAARLLMWEKDVYGIDGIATLIIKYSCGQSFEELYRGRFLFGKYSLTTGDECYVKIPIEAAGDIMEFRNKFDQPVDLETLKGFDDITILPSYPHLPFAGSLPGKAISIKDHFTVSEQYDKGFKGVMFDSPNPIFGTTQIKFGFNGPVVSEIGNTGNETTMSESFLDTSAGNPPFIQVPFDNISEDWILRPLDLDPFINISPDGPNYNGISNPVKLTIRIKGRLTVGKSKVANFSVYLGRLPNQPGNINNGEESDDYIWLFAHNFFFTTDTAQYLEEGEGIDFDFSYNTPNNFEKDDRFYLIFSVADQKTHAQYLEVENNGAHAYSIRLDTESIFKAENLSKTKSTPCKLFMVNEAMSRASEAITNGKIRALSDYFGRTDSQPYPRPIDGCGALEAITKGLFIRRQEEKLIDRPPVFSLSLKQIFDGLDPIHHIGLGIEKDPYRPGYNCLRVENWKHFYSDEVILTCNNVAKIDRPVQENEHYSLFSFGYEKWEAEEYTGLDEFLTKRKYRTTLSSISNELTKLSKFIASGYAIEITRRKGNEDSKDWRYDNDTFIICLSRESHIYNALFTASSNSLSFSTNTDGSEFLVNSVTIEGTVNNNGTRALSPQFTSISSGINGYQTFVVLFFSGGTTVDETIAIANLNVKGLSVEQGQILSPENIIDPDSIYNYRISPIRNAMRWFDEVAAGFKMPGKIIFTDGDGNFWAKGKYSGPCAQEDGAIRENDPIESASFISPADASPILQPERVVFDYDLSAADFRKIQDNPYGLIGFNNDFESGFGWIDTVSAKHNDGMGTFRLIPKK